MSIRQEKFRQILNGIIKSCIQNGEFPSEQAVLSKLRAILAADDLSLPYTKFSPIIRGSKIDKDAFNKNIDDTHKDLTLLYKKCGEINNGVSKNFDLFEKQYQQLEYEVSKLEDEMHHLIEVNSSPEYLNCAYDSLCDFSKINQEETTADVNITTHSATISSNKNTSRRIIDAANIEAYVPEYYDIIDSESDGDVDYINNDYSNDIFSFRITTRNSEGCPLAIVFDYGSDVVGSQNGVSISANKIVYDFASSTPVQVFAKYTPDGINTFDIPSQHNPMTVLGKAEINFTMTNCLRVLFVLYKNKYDSVVTIDGQNAYVYDFSIRSIGLYAMYPSDSAVFVSAPLDPVKSIENFSISKVSLYVDEEKPNTTNIEYYVALNETEKNWIRISPANHKEPKYQTVVDFMSVDDNSNSYEKIDSLKPLAEYEITDLNANGIKMYSIHETDKLLLNKTLYKGVNASYVEYMPTTNSEYVPNIDEFVPSRREYYNITSGNIIFNNIPDQNCIVKTSVNFINSTGNKSVDLLITAPYATAVYCNNKLARYLSRRPGQDSNVQVTGQIPVSLKHGMNNITVITYAKAGSVCIIDTGLNLISAFGEVYAHGEPMDEVDIFELQHNIMSNDNMKYAIYKSGNKRHVIVNSPEQDIVYKISYSYASKKIDSILFKAVLTRNNPYISSTPVMHGYTLYCK